MRNNYKKNKRPKNQRPENGQPRSRQPNQDYMSRQFDPNTYSGGTYYNKPSSSNRSNKSNTAPNRKSRPTRTAPPKPNTKRTSWVKAKKKRTKFFIGRIIFLISFIIGVIYVISIVLETTQKPVISYQMVQRGIIDNSDVFEGLIVRNEKVIPNPAEGNMYLIAAEGEKVKKGGQVYQILDPAQSSVLEQDIQNVESDIEKVQVQRQDISYFQNEIQEINKSIDNNMEIYYMQSELGNLKNTHELKKQLEHEIQKRKNIHMKDKAVALDELKDQKIDLRAKLSSSEKVYTAQEPGIISYYTDGFEDKFTFDHLDKISEKDIKEKYSNTSTTANQIIGANEPAYRIIKDNQWKVVCFMPESWAERFKVGKNYEFSLIDDSSIEFTLTVEESIPGEKKHKVIFSSNEQLDSFGSTRTVSFKSLQYMYEGLKIPTSAVTERNLIKVPLDYIVSSGDGKGVMKSSATGESVFVDLNIHYEDESGYAHILQRFDEGDGLKLGDTINHPSKTEKIFTVSEVSTVKGVYAVNGRITRFKPITTIAQNDQYLIVKPNSLNGLKQFDQIVTNPKNIQEEQLLRNMDVKNNK